VLATAVILTALAFEYLGGHAPCPLCLMERYAYYASIPVLFLALAGLSGGHPWWATFGFFLVGLAFMANAGLGGYHTGAEWGFWPGPSTCGGGLAPLTSPADLLKGGRPVKVIRCDQASWWFLGLSFAGWNTLISIGLWITAWQASRLSARTATTQSQQISL
jgi:disulfide bond formation protein DsbB